MPQYEFIDKIVNTISLQVKPNNKYKNKNPTYSSSSDSNLITKTLYHNQSYSSDLGFPTLQAYYLDYIDNSFNPIQIDLPENNYYFSSTNTLYINDGFFTQEEYDSILTLNAQPEKSEEYLSSNTYYNSSQVIVSQETPTVQLDTYSSVYTNSSLSTLFVESENLTYLNFNSANEIKNTFIFPQPLYIQNTEDTLDLAVDLSANIIFEVEEKEASVYTPPDPSDITIISLKEFWA
jgi:hypothetical protein